MELCAGRGETNNFVHKDVSLTSNESTIDLMVQDTIHGLISVPPVLAAIVDTPQFSRLRCLRISGLAHYVFPMSKQSRWEHSLGVMHLAGNFCDKIQKDNPSLVNQVDKICVMMAGLCHDLGHGPFSHLWESFVEEARPGHTWHHEKSSIEMLDFLIEDNDLMTVFYKHGLTDRDIVFVKEMIYFPDKDAVYEGRGPGKHFLYEIVANKTSGVDVDKWDYMLRDNAALNAGVTFHYEHLILHSGVVDVEGKMRLCFRDREVENLQEMFLDRARLHRKGYQHKLCKMIDRMMVDVIMEADPFLFCVRSREGNMVPISKACDDAYTHAQLSDEFLVKTIQNSIDPKLEKARGILKRIVKRDLYKLIGTVECIGSFDMKEKEMEVSLQEMVDKEEAMEEKSKVIKRTIDMGMGKNNPLEKILFFDKKGKITAFHKDHLRKMMPEQMRQETIFVVCRGDVNEAKNITFMDWANRFFSSKEYHIQEGY